MLNQGLATFDLVVGGPTTGIVSVSAIAQQQTLSSWTFSLVTSERPLRLPAAQCPEGTAYAREAAVCTPCAAGAFSNGTVCMSATREGKGEGRDRALAELSLLRARSVTWRHAPLVPCDPSPGVQYAQWGGRVGVAMKEGRIQ